ncbi:MAG TPA: flavin reductase family protein [Rubrivivax sp.]|nr:flavin reductase family protein [Rubrivivax sp.]
MNATRSGRPNIDTRTLRQTLGRFATGVTLVTCCDPEGRFVGLTVNSFSSLSLDPPLVLWSLQEGGPNMKAFLAATSFAVNVLAESQISLSQRFSGGEPDRFAEGDWSLGAHGAPILEGCCAVLQCRSVSHQVAGDHRLFIGQVLHCADRDLPPLLFHSACYRRLGARL